jgi:hypothetical protein
MKLASMGTSRRMVTRPLVMWVVASIAALMQLAAPGAAGAASDPASPSVSMVPVSGLQQNPIVPAPLRVDGVVTNSGDLRGTFMVTVYSTKAPFLLTKDRQFNGVRMKLRSGDFTLRCLAAGSLKRTCRVSLAGGESVTIATAVDRQWRQGSDGSWGEGSNRVDIHAKVGTRSDSDFTHVSWGAPQPQGSVNGCGSDGWTAKLPDRPAGVSFTAGCNKHDHCYGGRNYAGRYTHYRLWKSRRTCDQVMLADTLRECRRFSLVNAASQALSPRGWCETTSVAYFNGLRALSKAKEAYLDPHNDACDKDAVNPSDSPECRRKAARFSA